MPKISTEWEKYQELDKQGWNVSGNVEIRQTIEDYYKIAICNKTNGCTWIEIIQKIFVTN